jgi:hypothetical protein
MRGAKAPRIFISDALLRAHHAPTRMLRFEPTRRAAVTAIEGMQALGFR